jgi:hypothetical protein
MKLEEYEATRPKGETKVEFYNAIVRVYQNPDGEIRVLIHSRSEYGFEELPLGYLLGSNYAIFKPSK